MADDFQSGICSGSWWNTQRSGAATGFDASAAASASCSTAITDAGSGAGSLSWSTAAESVASGPLTDSSLQISGYGLSPSTMDWNQPLLRSGGGAEPSFHALLQETPPFNYFRQDPSIEPDQVVQAGTGDSSSSNLYKDISQTNFLLDQHHHHQQQQQQLSSGNESGANYGMPGFPAASYGCPSTVLQGLFEPDNKSQQSFYQPPMIGYSSNDPMAKLSQFLKSGSSPPKQQSSTSHLNFANNAPFWNPSSVPSLPVQFGAHSFEQKPSCSNLTTKSNPQGVRDSCSSATKKSSSSCSSEPALKKPRIETPSPLPTFKVRKEKLGDRITALQQLVSPFGKTDTASVLHEAIEYIKFLHEQVSVLSTPYLKNGHPMQHHESSDKSKDGEGPKQDLRSRGLCLVPVASTYPVASETNADFWTPTFGGTYR